MQLTFTLNEGDGVYSLEVGGDLKLSDLKTLLEDEISIPRSEQQLVHDMKVLTKDDNTLSNYNLKDGDIIIITRKPLSDSPRPSAPSQSLPRIDWSQVQVGPSSSRNTSTVHSQGQSGLGINWSGVQVPAGLVGGAQAQPHPQSSLSEVDRLWDELIASPQSISLLAGRNPPLGEALMKRDKEKFKKVYQEQEQWKRDNERDRIRLLNSDPFDQESQKKIADTIQQTNVEENMRRAMEHTPESFGQVTMLYINCKANNQPLKAFIDSGAQMTFMSSACAERCNLMHLIDQRWQGLAKGVGTQKIIGRVHICQIQIGEDFLSCSFNILEDQEMDLLIGLDMLKRHQVMLHAGGALCDTLHPLICVRNHFLSGTYVIHSCQQSRFFLDCPGNKHLVQVSRKAGNLSRITTCKLEI